MKKLLVVLLSLLMLVACTGGKTPEEPEKPDTPETTVEYLGFGNDTYFGSTSNATADADGVTEFDTTYAFVATDEAGVITYVKFDVAQNKVSYAADGTITVSEDTRTKVEKQGDYNMKTYGNSVGELYEEVAALEAWLVGKTAEDFNAAIDWQDGSSKATDADLLAGCTINVGDFYKALVNAVANRVAVEGVAAKGAGSYTHYDEIKNPTADEDATVTLNTDMFAVAVDADGKIVYASHDSAQNKVTINAKGEATLNEDTRSKKAKQGDYNMKTYGNSVGEWFEEVAALESWCLGKTVEEVSAVVDWQDGSSKANDADLLAGCTINIGGAVKALEAAEIK